MNYFNTLHRYISGNNEGMVGKISQHNDIFIENMDNVPKANEIISKELLSKLDDKEIVAKHRGTMGIIYQGHYKEKKISIKVIPENIKKIINEETSILNIAYLFGIINKGIIDLSEDLQLRIKNELKMDLEYNNYYLVHNNPNIKLFKSRTVNVIDFLCDSDHFVYEYEDHDMINKYIPILSENKRIDICIRIISIYFQLQSDNIFMGDLNFGNFLYDFNNDEIILIDYGCILKTTENFRISMKILLFNFLYAENTIYLNDTFCNGSHKCKNLLDQIHYILGDREINFSEIQLDFGIFDFNSISGSKFVPESLTVLRSISHLLLLAKKMEINYNIRTIIEKNVKFDGDLSKYQPSDINYLISL